MGDEEALKKGDGLFPQQSSMQYLPNLSYSSEFLVSFVSSFLSASFC